MPAWPSLRELINGDEEGLGPYLAAKDLPGLAPQEILPANGGTTEATGSHRGAIRLAVGALTGDGSKQVFAVKHGMNATPLDVTVYTVGSASTLGVPGRAAWAKDATDVLNTVRVAFAVAPPAGSSYYVVVQA